LVLVMTDALANGAYRLAAMAGLDVPPDRRPALEAGFAAMRTQAGTLTRAVARNAEPAARFHPPPAR
jgi:hypothetical protein